MTPSGIDYRRRFAAELMEAERSRSTDPMDPANVAGSEATGARSVGVPFTEPRTPPRRRRDLA
jgi:hypothetical protein